jgi:hypothetical protein
MYVSLPNDKILPKRINVSLPYGMKDGNLQSIQYGGFDNLLFVNYDRRQKACA